MASEGREEGEAAGIEMNKIIIVNFFIGLFQSASSVLLIGDPRGSDSSSSSAIYCWSKIL